MPSLADVEDWLESQWPEGLRELPQQVVDKAHEYYTHLYNEIVRYGPVDLQVPTHSEVLEQLKKLQEQAIISVPEPPPPPPETSSTVVSSALGWAHDHPIATVVGVTATSVGLGFAFTKLLPNTADRVVGKLNDRVAVPARRTARVRNGIRREAVVVLGADTPLGRALLINLTSQGLIVIAAVSSATSLKSVDAQLLPSSRGYVAVRHFDLTSLPASVDRFVAEVKSALALRFPLNASGDPFARPGDGAILIGIINALSYVPPDPTLDGNLPHVASSAAHAGALLQRALSTHVTAPISAIAALLPELRIGAQRIYNQNPDYLTPLTVVTLVDGGASGTEGDKSSRLVTESAANTALHLRESAPMGTHASVQVGPVKRESRILRFTVLSVPRSSSKGWSSDDVLTTGVTDSVANLVLASDATQPLPPRTYVSLPGPSVSVIFTPLLQSLRRAQQVLLAVLPTTLTQWLEALYRAASSACRQVLGFTSMIGTHHRRRHNARDLRRSSTGTTVTQTSRDSAQHGSNYLSLPGRTPHPPRSGTSAELDAPSSLETGSSADDEDVLRSAPSSAFDEEEDHLRNSPWLASSVAPSQSAGSPLPPSSVAEGTSSHGSTPSASQHWNSPLAASTDTGLDQSWVQLGESALRESADHWR